MIRLRDMCMNPKAINDYVKIAFTCIHAFPREFRKAFVINDVNNLKSPLGDGFHTFEILLFYGFIHSLWKQMSAKVLLRILRRMKDVLYPHTTNILLAAEEDFTSNVIEGFGIPQGLLAKDIKKQIVGLLRGNGAGELEMRHGHGMLLKAARGLKNADDVLSDANIHVFMTKYLGGYNFFENARASVNGLNSLVNFFNVQASVPGRVTKTSWIDHLVSVLQRCRLVCSIGEYLRWHPQAKIRDPDVGLSAHMIASPVRLPADLPSPSGATLHPPFSYNDMSELSPRSAARELEHIRRGIEHSRSTVGLDQEGHSMGHLSPARTSMFGEGQPGSSKKISTEPAMVLTSIPGVSTPIYEPSKTRRDSPESEPEFFPIFPRHRSSGDDSLNAIAGAPQPANRSISGASFAYLEPQTMKGSEGGSLRRSAGPAFQAVRAAVHMKYAVSPNARGEGQHISSSVSLSGEKYARDSQSNERFYQQSRPEEISTSPPRKTKTLSVVQYSAGDEAPPVPVFRRDSLVSQNEGDVPSSPISPPPQAHTFYQDEFVDEYLPKKAESSTGDSRKESPAALPTITAWTGPSRQSLKDREREKIETSPVASEIKRIKNRLSTGKGEKEKKPPIVIPALTGYAGNPLEGPGVHVESSPKSPTSDPESERKRKQIRTPDIVPGLTGFRGMPGSEVGVPRAPYTVSPKAEPEKEKRRQSDPVLPVITGYKGVSPPPKEPKRESAHGSEVEKRVAEIVMRQQKRDPREVEDTRFVQPILTSFGAQPKSHQGSSPDKQRRRSKSPSGRNIGRSFTGPIAHLKSEAQFFPNEVMYYSEAPESDYDDLNKSTQPVLTERQEPKREVSLKFSKGAEILIPSPNFPLSEQIPGGVGLTNKTVIHQPIIATFAPTIIAASMPSDQSSASSSDKQGDTTPAPHVFPSLFMIPGVSQGVPTNSESFSSMYKERNIFANSMAAFSEYYKPPVRYDTQTSPLSSPPQQPGTFDVDAPPQPYKVQHVEDPNNPGSPRTPQPKFTPLSSEFFVARGMMLSPQMHVPVPPKLGPQHSPPSPPKASLDPGSVPLPAESSGGRKWASLSRTRTEEAQVSATANNEIDSLSPAARQAHFESVEKTRDLVYKSLIKAGMSPERSQEMATQFVEESPRNIDRLKRATALAPAVSHSPRALSRDESFNDTLSRLDRLMRKADARLQDD